jgi:hypothetical protein
LARDGHRRRCNRTDRQFRDWAHGVLLKRRPVSAREYTPARKLSPAWCASAIESDWDGYCAESQGIIEALTQRIIRENRDLYPLAEREKKAA